MLYDIGTRVRIKEEGADAKVKVVHEVSATPDWIRYAVNGTAWIEHEELEFIEAPSEASLAEARHWYDDADQDLEEDEYEGDEGFDD